MEVLQEKEKSSTEENSFYVISEFNDNGKTLHALIEELLIESISN